MRAVCLCILMVLLTSLVGVADVPQTMSYQGVLRDAVGDPVADGDYSITFALYSAATGGAALWEETQSVSVEDGVFNAVLGSVTPLELSFSQPYWLGISVEGEAELSPRVELASAPYALRAAVADWAMTGAPDSDWVMSGDNIYRLTGYVGIGVEIPSSKLEVGGTAKVAGFQMPTSAAAGRVLTSDASGVGTWQAMPAGFTLPYEGSGAVPETSAVFKIWSTDTGSAIYGQNSHFMGGTAGYLADTFDGVVGEHFETRNFGTLGSMYYGVHAKARSADGTAIYGRHDPSMHSVHLANAEYAGDFRGDVVVQNGSLAVGTDTPAEDLDVRGEVDITSDVAATILDVKNSSASTIGRTVNIDRTADPTPGNDILEMSTTSTAPDNFQFIECDRAGTIEWAVNGNGTTTSKGSYLSRDIQVCEMMAVGAGARSAEPGDVMVIDPASGRTVERSSKARSTLVVGIYCAEPGFVGSSRGWVRDGAADDDRATTYSIQDMADEFGEIPLAIVGVVPCRVSAENGAVSPGDLLVTSDTPGHAMRDGTPAPGTILGKALERLDAGVGVIDVLVGLQ
jgi:hypothetical protein